MPTYAYKCENGHLFEEFQSIADLPIEFCPQCGAHAERQITGGAGLIFKGSGFYLTDYARKSSKPDTSSSQHSEQSSSKTETSSDTAKTESKGKSE